MRVKAPEVESVFEAEVESVFEAASLVRIQYVFKITH
jgi:hypothetical protein